MKQNMSIPVNAIVKALEIPCSDQLCNTQRAAAIKQLRRIEAYPEIRALRDTGRSKSKGVTFNQAIDYESESI